jgi:hypothetical protein
MASGDKDGQMGEAICTAGSEYGVQSILCSLYSGLTVRLPVADAHKLVTTARPGGANSYIPQRLTRTTCTSSPRPFYSACENEEKVNGPLIAR